MDEELTAVPFDIPSYGVIWHVQTEFFGAKLVRFAIFALVLLVATAEPDMFATPFL
jgi:hypothetical protein